jgi:CHAT domain-containing protein/tetratricopeptide (TPR) repeat protein
MNEKKHSVLSLPGVLLLVLALWAKGNVAPDQTSTKGDAAQAQQFAEQFYETAQRGSTAEFQRLWLRAGESKVLDRRDRLYTLLPTDRLRTQLCEAVQEGKPIVVSLRFPERATDTSAPCHRLVLERIGASFRVSDESSAAEALASSIVKQLSACKSDVCGHAVERATSELARALYIAGEQQARENRKAMAGLVIELARDTAQRTGNMATQVDAMLSLSSLAVDANKPAEAETLLNDAEKLAAQSGDPQIQTRSEIQRGRWFYGLARYKPAIDTYGKAFDRARTLKNARLIVAATINLSAVEMDLGLYTLADSHLQIARKSALAEADQESLASSLHNSGDLQLEFGNPQSALRYYQQSLAIKRRLGIRKKICTTLDSIGVAYIATEKYALALTTLAEADTYASDDVGRAYIFDHEGSAYAGRDNFTKAIERHRKAIEFGKLGKDDSIVAAAEINLAEALRKSHDYAGALLHLRKGEELSRNLGAQPVLWQALASAGELYRAKGDRKAAEAAASEAISVIESLRNQVPGGILPRQDFFENKLAPYGLMMESALAKNDAKTGLGFNEQARARTLLDTVQARRKRVTSEMSAEEIQREEQLDLDLRFADLDLADATGRENPDNKEVTACRERLRLARQGLEAFQDELYRAKPDLKARRGLAEWHAQDFAGVLPSEETLVLEYSFIGTKPYVFSIRKNEGAIRIASYPLTKSSTEIGARIGDFLDVISKRSGGFQKQAEDLYDDLIGPAVQDLRGMKTVVIVPDGPVWQLPFGALRHDGRFWIQDIAIAYVPSLAVLQETSRHTSAPVPAKPPRLLAMFNPDGPEYIRNLQANGLGTLPDAADAIRAFRETYRESGAEVVTGADASELRFKRPGGRFDVYHFMTHSILNDKSPIHSAILLAGTHGREDGRLEAREIMDLRLDADLAVLSACKTMGQRVTPGEGLLGMSWAFFLAGTSNVVASQWLVEGKATNDLMVRFHRALVSERQWRGSVLPKARSLQQASIEMIQGANYNHPFYWASFEAFGTRL